MEGDTGLYFQLLVGLLALAIALGAWIWNRKRKREGRELHVDTTVLTLAVTVVGAIVILVARSPLVRQNPLLVGLAALIAVALGVAGVNLSVTMRLRAELASTAAAVHAQMAGLGNIQFFQTKEETFRKLADLTHSVRDKLFATRFSPGDISTERDYYATIRSAAMSPEIHSYRVHCLAHFSKVAIEGTCRLISDLMGAKKFTLGIAFFNNSFEVIVTDDSACMFCFHDLNMTIKNGFLIQSDRSSSAAVVNNMSQTFRQMLARCHIVVDFEKFVTNEREAELLQAYLRQVHRLYCQGQLPRPVHEDEMEAFLTREVFAPGRSWRQDLDEFIVPGR